MLSAHSKGDGSSLRTGIWKLQHLCRWMTRTVIGSMWFLSWCVLKLRCRFLWIWRSSSYGLIWWIGILGSEKTVFSCCCGIPGYRNQLMLYCWRWRNSMKHLANLRSQDKLCLTKYFLLLDMNKEVLRKSRVPKTLVSIDYDS